MDEAGLTRARSYHRRVVCADGLAAVAAQSAVENGHASAIIIKAGGTKISTDCAVADGESATACTDSGRKSATVIVDPAAFNRHRANEVGNRSIFLSRVAADVTILNVESSEVGDWPVESGIAADRRAPHRGIAVVVENGNA